MDVYGHLMETVNRQAAKPIGKSVLGEKKDYSGATRSGMVARNKNEVSATALTS
jgi:hypothetical protein